jgi:hypothetical protein
MVATMTRLAVLEYHSIFEELHINEINKTVLIINQNNKDIQLDHIHMQENASYFRYSILQDAVKSCALKISSTCSTSDTRRVTLVKNR